MFSCIYSRIVQNPCAGCFLIVLLPQVISCQYVRRHSRELIRIFCLWDILSIHAHPIHIVKEPSTYHHSRISWPIRITMSQVFNPPCRDAIKPTQLEQQVLAPSLVDVESLHLGIQLPQLFVFAHKHKLRHPRERKRRNGEGRGRAERNDVAGFVALGPEVWSPGGPR